MVIKKDWKGFVILFEDDTKLDTLTIKQDLEVHQEEIGKLKKSFSYSTQEPDASFGQIGE